MSPSEGPFTFDVSGARLAGEQRGHGSAAVFLHAGVADRRMWYPQIDVLCDALRCVAYDRRGFGATVCEDVPFSHVADLLAVLDHCGLEAAWLVGCSQGGRIAIDTALAHPERVAGLVLIAPAISGAPEAEATADEAGRVAELTAAEEADDVDAVNRIEATIWLDGPTSPEGRVGAAARELVLDMNGIALRHPPLSGEAEPPSAWARLSEVGQPTVVIWGDRDFAFIADNCRHLLASIPHARGVTMTGAAHLPGLEQPEALNALLREAIG